MVVDTSALCAVLFDEPEGQEFSRLLATEDRKFLSALTALEVGMVVESRWGPEGTQRLETLLDLACIDVVAIDASLSEVALDGWRRFGKGRHRAGLNLGDCASYALAKVLHQPLLYKGDDFTFTDVARQA